MTTTIAWSLIWSVVPGLVCDDSGLTVANQPWSGHYEVDAAIWTSAHWGQFVKPGWRLLSPGAGAGSGFMDGGGSYVAAVEFTADGTTANNFSVVIETLQGRGRCQAPNNTTAPQSVLFHLAPELAALVPPDGLQLWRSTNETLFAKQAAVLPVKLAGGRLAVTLTIDVDAMYTLSTVTTAFHGHAATPIPGQQPLQLPYTDTFDSYTNDTMARYFTDEGGSFSVETDSAHGNGVLKQWVRERPGANSWGGPKPSNPPPLTLIGDVGWQAYETCIDAGMDGCIGSDNASGCFVMLCAHATSESPWSGWPPSALCLQINNTAKWGLVAYHNLRQGYSQYASGHYTQSTSNRLCISFTGCGNVTASIDGVSVLEPGFQLPSNAGVAATGRVALGSGWHTAHFDNFSTSAVTSPKPDGPLFQCVTLCNGTQLFNGYVGGMLVLKKPKTIRAVARYCGAAGSVPFGNPTQGETVDG